MTSSNKHPNDFENNYSATYIDAEELIDLITSHFTAEEILPQGEKIIINKQLFVSTSLSRDPDRHVPRDIAEINPDGSDIKALRELLPEYMARLTNNGEEKDFRPTHEEYSKMSSDLGWIPKTIPTGPNDYRNLIEQKKEEIKTEIKAIHKSRKIRFLDDCDRPQRHFDEFSKIRCDIAREIFLKFIKDESKIPGELNITIEDWDYKKKQAQGYGELLEIALEHFKKIGAPRPSAADILKHWMREKPLEIEAFVTGFRFKPIDGPKKEVSKDALEKRINDRIITKNQDK